LLTSRKSNTKPKLEKSKSEGRTSDQLSAISQAANEDSPPIADRCKPSANASGFQFLVSASSFHVLVSNIGNRQSKIGNS
jgi:hypothetical protein